MKFQNQELEPLMNFLLNELSLAGKKNRMRMKFIGMLGEAQQEFTNYHMQLIKEHANLDEHGKPVVNEVDGEELYDVKNIQEFNIAYNELLSEEVFIEENDANKEILISVKDSVENCTKEFSGQDAILHESICARFDNIYTVTE